MKQQIILGLKGAAMGMAETIPGVSGGTLAFITGIYERLINSIKAFDLSLLKILRAEGFGAVWKKIDGNFLFALLSGMAVGVIISLIVISYLLENYPPIVWAFFFGLIIASIIYVGKGIKGWNASVVLSFIVGTFVAYGITQIPMAQANESLWFIFICGAVAVSAFILPGISGSFILLILGMYQFILHETLKEGVLSNQDPHAILIMAVFACGMVIGLATFSRVLSWAFKSYHNQTLALLTGFMLGAMSKLWPWRIPTTIMNEEGEVLDFVAGMEVDKIIQEVNVLPARYASDLGEPTFLFATIASLVAGFVLVLYLDHSTKMEL